MLDSFIGSKFGNLEVIGWDGSRVRGAKSYTIKCHICTLDSELHGKGVYYSDKRSMLLGKLPCGCSKTPKWTPEQYEIRLNRVLEAKDYSRVCNVTLTSVRTRVTLCCDKGHTYTAILSAPLCGFGCKECNGCMGGSSPKSHSNFISDCISKNVDKYFDLSEVVYIGATSKVKTTCLFCGDISYRLAGTVLASNSCKRCFHKTVAKSNEEFILECTALGFAPNIDLSEIVYVNSFAPVQVSCKLCGDRFITRPQYLLRKTNGGGCFKCTEKANKQIKHIQTVHKFKVFCKSIESLDFSDFEYKSCYENSSVSCKVCKKTSLIQPTELWSGKRCSFCSNSGFNKNIPSILYIVEFAIGETLVTGFGITKNIVSRMRTHSRYLSALNSTVNKMKLFNLLGEKTLFVETNMKRLLPIYNTGVEGFKTEATLLNFDEVCNIANIFTGELGGN
jgi:hypothetical protein